MVVVPKRHSGTPRRRNQVSSNSAKRKSVVNPRGAPPPSGPYSRAVRFGNLVFVSGVSARAPDGTPFRGTVGEETANVLEIIGRILEAAGSSMEKVLKVTVILNNPKDWSKMNAVYTTYFRREPPARTTFQSNLGDAKVEMDAVAYV
jgi:2-iminobutanoate/2-iminopropanoate deaminase